MVRLKSRYLLCEVNVSKRSELLLLDDRSVAKAVRAAVARMHGDYGAALCSLRFSGCYKLLWSALPFITSIESGRHIIPCFLNCLCVGGTIKTCQKFLIRYNAQQLHRMLPECKNEEEKMQVRQAILSCCLLGGTEDESEEDSESEKEEEGFNF